MGYFTNSALGTFARVLIDKHGNKACDMEVLVRHPYPSPREIHDDFALDSEGNTYIAAHSSSVFKIAPDGQQTLLAGGMNTSTLK
ncbi:hypothetical protein UCDDA912_g08126 [Diaporthe ampelina]|uniref:SMP-30/Gluconolactonase/LRE-like region domain-containing protein n=1 Tax=Diaporthe ampelina TaxID=1214573 RepID=A0A0G2FCQ9_9PEZI|nr:hypothetical protein UCDDA912_g08126 [Diaporthe ampelina]